MIGVLHRPECPVPGLPEHLRAPGTRCDCERQAAVGYVVETDGFTERHDADGVLYSCCKTCLHDWRREAVPEGVSPRRSVAAWKRNHRCAAPAKTDTFAEACDLMGGVLVEQYAEVGDDPAARAALRGLADRLTSLVADR